MITAMIMEIAEPKFHSPTVMNWFSMTLPIRKYCPPPSSLGMKNAETVHGYFSSRSQSVIL